MRQLSPSSLTVHRPRPARSALRTALALAASILLHGNAGAVDFGPFTLSGFAKAEATRVSTLCKDCQRDASAPRDFIWADELVQGKPYGAGDTHVTLFQPYLQFKQDLPRGFKLQALVSQRWRDGKEDFKGFLYEGNVAVSHEEYGSLRVGAMTTRAWSLADYPYGSNLNLADPWGSSGAGYGILTRAVRYTSRPLDFYEGDLVLEATYDMGKAAWKRNKPQFLELYAQYHKGDLVVDAMVQDTRNGTPSAFSHGPFTGLFYDARFDGALGSSSQGIAMVMARYQVNARVEVSGGVRANRWSGAYAVFLQSAAQNPGGYDIWNAPFNVDWSTDLGGGVYRGYPARSVDAMAGVRYRTGPWTASTGMMVMGRASTSNPSERGQSNSALINTVGLNYDWGHGLQTYGFAGMVNYAKKGLAPLTMPSNSAFTNVDSRLTRHGNWVGVGTVYTF